MAITTYAELLTAAANWLDRTDLTDRVPEFVVLAEARLNRVIRTPEMLTANDAFTVDAASEAVPTGYLGVKRFALLTDPQVTLEYLSADALAEKRNWLTAAGKPAYYSVIGTNFEFLPTPDQSYTGALLYYARLTPLATATNWLLTSHPDIYLYGTLAAAEPFLKNDERVIVWKSMLEESIQELTAQAERQMVGARPRVRARPLGLPARYP